MIYSESGSELIYITYSRRDLVSKSGTICQKKVYKMGAVSIKSGIYKGKRLKQKAEPPC